MSLEIIVLAAGQGTRMRSSLPKVLHPLGGTPLLGHVLRTVRSLNPTRIHVVVGHGSDQVKTAFKDNSDDINWVDQTEQLGTAHAVSQAVPHLSSDQALIVYGDIPMIRSTTLEQLVEVSKNNIALLTAVLDDPRVYGRIIRDNNSVVGIVEDKEATEAQKTINEINTGFISAPTELLKETLSKVKNDNAKGEFYLTDVIHLSVDAGHSINDIQAFDEAEITGVNNRAELSLLERDYQKARAFALAETGVTILDPNRLDQRGDVEVGVDSSIDVNVILEGPVKIGQGVSIGPNCYLKDVVIADNVTIQANTVVEQAIIGADVTMGPFARIRPGTKLDDEVHIGNFVELKNAQVAKGSKINHLSYVGDSEVGSGTNIGAGVITCNYDGANKHKTQIGDEVFVGSNSQLVAPVQIGKGATIGAGSTVTQNVPEGSLAVARSKQRNVPGWKRPTKSK